MVHLLFFNFFDLLISRHLTPGNALPECRVINRYWPGFELKIGIMLSLGFLFIVFFKLGKTVALDSIPGGETI
jgi:hypothetical protein